MLVVRVLSIPLLLLVAAYRQSHAQAKRLLTEKKGQWEQRHAECTDALHSLVETRYIGDLETCSENEGICII